MGAGNPNWTKGVSGNPSGRKPRAVEEKFTKRMASRVKLADWDEIIDTAVKLAKRGDPSARKWLSDYLMGTPVNRTEILGKDGTPQEFGVVPVDYRVAIAALAPRPMDDSESSSEGESAINGETVG